jgi:WD40 repeat protein
MNVGPYVVLGELGRGGAGVVYRARSPAGEEVAVKVLLRAEGAALARFERERRLLDGLREHEGFVPLLDAGSSPTGPYLVMPYLRGGTLRARLENGPLGRDEALGLVGALAAALARAHASGIIHRDLKPENVLFDEQARPLIADLGLAKHFTSSTGAGASTALSKTNEYRGTVGYMAPEQASDAKNVGPQADVFSLGAILYECLVGERPFDGESPIEVIARATDHRYERLRARSPEAPAWLDRAIDGALAARPEERPRDAAAFARTLEPATSGRSGRLALALVPLAGLAVGAFLLVGRAAAPQARPDVAETTSAVATPTPERGLPAWTRKVVAGKTLRLIRVYGRLEWNELGPLRDFVVEPDSRHVAVSGEQGGVRVFDLASGETSGDLRSGGARSAGLTLTRDGARLLAFDAHRTLRVWNAATHTIVSARRITNGAQDLARPAFSPDGSRLALFDEKGALLLHDTETGALLLRAGSGFAGRAFFTADGLHLLVADDAGHVELLDLADGTASRAYDAASPARPLALAPRGTRALLGTSKGVVSWDLVTGESTDFVAQAAVAAAAFAPDGKLVALAHEKGTLELRDATTGEPVRALERRVPGAASIGFSPDGARVVVASPRVLRVFDAGTGKLLAAFGSSHDVGDLALTADGRRLAVADDQDTITVWDTTSGDVVGWLEASRFGQNRTRHAFTADGRLVVICRGNADGAPSRFLSWDPGTDRDPEVMIEDMPVSCCALTADGVFAATGTVLPFSIVKLWDLRRKEVGWQTTSRTGSAEIGLSPDAKLVVESSDQGVVSVHRIIGRDPDPLTFSGKVVFPEVSPRLVHALRNNEGVSALDPVTGARLWTLSREGAAFFALSPDERLALLGTGGRIELVDAGTRRVLDKIETGDRWPREARFAPDGRRFFVATLEGIVLEVELRPAGPR